MKNNYLLLLFLAITILSHVIHHRVYNSYKQQVIIYKAVNSANYEDASSEFYNNLEVDIPNLSITSLPLKAVKAIYMQVNGPKDSLQKSFDLYHKSMKDNPFLMFSEGHLAQIYFQTRRLDSAYYYARKSFLGLPNNAIHFAMISKLYANKGIYDSISISFDKINTSPRVDINNVYFASMVNFMEVMEDSLKKEVIKKAQIARKTFLIDKQLQLLVDYVIQGKEKIDSAVKIQEIGSKLLSENKFLEGIEVYKKALEIRKNYMPYIQTIGLALYNTGDYKKCIETLSILEMNGIDLDPISLYVKGKSHYYIGERQTGCDILLISSKFGNENSTKALKTLCQNY